MNSNAFNRFWEILGWDFALNEQAFQTIASIPNGLEMALLVVLLAGLSLAVGQSIILFINRVKPRRFILSLLLNAVLFTFGFLFLVLSTWLICLLPWSVQVSFFTLVRVLGISYAPLLFSFLGALPYFGVSILNLLSAWNLLAMVVGFGAVTGVGIRLAFGYIIFGWIVKHLLENTIGQPIARFGRILANRTAGVNLVKNQEELKKLILARTRPAEPIVTASPQSRSSRQSIPTTPTIITQRTDTAQPKQNNRSQLLKWLLSILVMAIAFIIILILMRPIRGGLFGWYSTLPDFLQLKFNLIWIGIVAIVFAGLLAPLEAMGWWAGWYGDDVDTQSPIVPSKLITRYIVYLDGIGQSGNRYTPDVEEFLTALKPILPENTELIQGLMMYSVLNKPLNEDRPLALLWKLADKMRWKNPSSLLGILVNLRNVLIVAVSSDKRYGPVYNQGIAQVIFDGLTERGYQPGSGIPITLLGYSGGGELSAASAPYLRRATGAPIEVISLGGVMSSSNNFLKLEHLYHIVGDKDSVERLGPIMFPGRWKLFPLSYWNRAKRKGKITIFSVEFVGHQVPGGYMDPEATLPDGRTYLQQTLEIILQILRGEALRTEPSFPRKLSHYALYQQAAFTHPSYYPLSQEVDRTFYQPIGEWMGRLILPKPEERQQVKGALFEVHHTPPEYSHWVGRVVKLRWSNDPMVQQLVKAVTKDVHFSANAEYSSKYKGLIHPDRLNHWRQVDPLESLAGSHPVDDIIVMLSRSVTIEEEAIYIQNQPVQITGRYYALVKFLQSIPGTDQFRVIHFNRTSRQFDEVEEVVRLPSVMLAEDYGSYPSTTQDIEKSLLNETGWYIYGAKDAQGLFVVQSLAPRALFCLQPGSVVFGRKASYNYIHKRAWANTRAQKGQISSVLCSDKQSSIQMAINDWQEGDNALLIHTYGGIGGNKKEPAAATPFFFGHFAFGWAKVVREPLSDELRFDLCYDQVYTHNIDGLIAGILHWSRYLGDRQWGCVGTRPICDILIKLDSFTYPYTLNNQQISPLDLMLRQLQVMTSRYRIGDGTGGTYVGLANNCAQDSNQALFASIQTTRCYFQKYPQIIPALLTVNSKQERCLRDLQQLEKELKRQLQPLGAPRSDWEKNEYNLGSTLEDEPIRNLITGLGSWRTMLPRLASDTVVKIFLNHGASVWVLRTNQIGGYDPDIEPIAPITL